MKNLVGVALLLASCAALAQQDTTPQDCEQLVAKNPGNPYAYVFADFCRNSEANTQQMLAKLYGKPRPSKEVVNLPGRGTPAAERLGVACIAGTAMRRLPNGWEQLRDGQHNFLRCEEQRF